MTEPVDGAGAPQTDVSGSGPAPEGLDWDESAQPVEEVRSLFVTLGKAFRAYQLYDENNPVRQRFVDTLKKEFLALWDELDRLVVNMDEDRIYLGGAEVYHSESRNDSLAFLFFKDGVREITFLPGIETHELGTFLGVLQKARKLVPEGDDLLTVLWEAEMQYFQYQYVDLLAEGVELPEAGGGNTGAELQAALQAEDEEIAAQQEEEAHAGGAAADQPQTVKQDDFNPTLYVLDPKEMETLRAELEKEMARDTRSDVLKALFDRLEEPGNRERQSEILGILETLLPNFLSRGKLVAATNVLRELRRLEQIEGMFDEQRLSESRRILDGISTTEAIEELMQALFAGTIRASSAQLSSFLQFLRGTALKPLLRESEIVEHKELQSVLRKSVQGIAGKNQKALVSLLEEEDPLVAAAAAKLAAEMKIAEAGPPLARLLSHDDASVRLAAVEAATALKASSVASALEDRLEDEERPVRIAAARALAELRYPPAAKTLSDIVKGKRIRMADISEKVAVFEAYGTVAGEAAVGLLDALLNKKGGLLGKKESTEIRSAAALGLGCIDSPEARAALEKATQDEDAVVRSNVNRALRREEE
ncbi:MAG: HEAT repeat domain-containing protein [Longimicrobiales bacterium]|nr:HEAT repeat domain-containing protein [Longimicrobiales bacterium]